MSAVLELKRLLAETLVRSGLDYTDDILILNAFIRDFRWKESITAESVLRLWRKFLRRPIPPKHLFSVYLHIPYCSKKCHFCYCSTEVPSSRAVIDRYIPELKDEIRFFSPLLKGIPVRLFQVGGGTPNILTAGQLNDLLDFAVSRFTLEDDGMRIIEFTPANTDREKLAVARRRGFNRISFGVQSLNPEVLKRENREDQTYEMVANAIAWARELGFEIINVDLLLGLASETLESFLDGFRRIAELQPTSIIVPGLTMTDAYLKVMNLTREANQRRYEQELPKALEGMRRLCREHGYETENLKPNHGIWVMYAKETPREVLAKADRGDNFSGGGLSVLGLGHLARSRVFGCGEYERYPRLFDPAAPVYRMISLSAKEEMMRYLISALETKSRVEFDEFHSRFGEDARRRFELELKTLKALGAIRLDAGGFDYLPVKGTERIFYGLFLLLDVLAELPFANGGLNSGLLARLRRELRGISLGEAAACS